MADDQIQSGPVEAPGAVTGGPAEAERDGQPAVAEQPAPAGALLPRRAVLFAGVVLALGLATFLVLRLAFDFNMRSALGGAALLGVATVALAGNRVFTAPAARKADQPQPTTDNTREVVETVVFVVVLVLMLKSFVAEAFVIPTGSMAETLWGYQKVVECPACGFRFPVNCSDEVEKGSDDDRTKACKCPNCEKRIVLVRPALDNRQPAAWSPDQPSPDPNSEVEILDPGWSSGDRVLVAKFMYDLLNRPPDRLDVVVFKYPGNSNPLLARATDPLFPRSGPYKNHVPMNYIKRLVGLPGECIAVFNGDLYVLRRERGLRYDDLAGLSGEARRRGELELWHHQFMHPWLGDRPFWPNDDKAARRMKERWDAGEFEIVRKGPAQIVAMKRIVYDNDFPARDVKAVRWSGAGWAAEGRGFRRDEASLGWLRYAHLQRGAAQPSWICDEMGFNSNRGGHGPNLDERAPSGGLNWVGDLILECEATVAGAKGELVLELSKGVDRFRARFDLESGVCKLTRLAGGAETELASRPTAVKKPGTYRLRFANVDRRLTLWVDKDLPFDDGAEYEAPRDAEGQKDNDRKQPASVGATGGVTVRGLRLWRDTFYTPTIGEAVAQGGPLLMHVQPGHYLCMGDNSAHSSDGRSWGLVPERLLLGRAVLVYYPFKFPFWPLNSRVNRVGIIE